MFKREGSMRIVDLSHRIVFPHWRWKPERVVTSSHADGDLFTSSRIQMPLHGFTHVDAPLHFLPGAEAISDLPLDRWAREAAEWLAVRGVKAVGYDYPPDPSLRMNPEHPGTIAREHHVTHDVFFPRGIAVIEYLANLGGIGTPRTLFMALPLKVDG